MFYDNHRIKISISELYNGSFTPETGPANKTPEVTIAKQGPNDRIVGPVNGNAKVEKMRGWNKVLVRGLL